MAERYELSSELLDTIFTREIAPALFRTESPSRNPTLILVGAQPGAGKSRVNATVMSEHPEPVVAIIGDDLRAFHPAYIDLIRSEPTVMPDATAQASGQWVERSIAYAAENGISVLVEGTFRRADVTLSTARRFKERGFRVQVVLLAVSPEVSRLSIARRYLRDVETSGHGRFTSLVAHNAAYDAIPDTIKAITAAGSPIHRRREFEVDALLQPGGALPRRSIGSRPGRRGSQPAVGVRPAVHTPESQGPSRSPRARP